MTDQVDTSKGRSQDVKGWVHFCIASAILAGVAVGFPATIRAFKMVTEKHPVPWPDSVLVDSDTFRWTNLPEQIGDRFFLVEDGEFGGETDGIPDGEIMLRDDIMETLGIGTGWDKKRVGDRSSNWLSVRLYKDATRPPDHPLRHWNLEVYYYTGALDTVPHVPERCLAAGGAAVTDSGETSFRLPQLPSPWDGELKFRRTLYEVTDAATLSTRQLVQYYIFSLNGAPEGSWEAVRLHLAKPWVPYCYFAKIQFYPRPSATSRQLDVREMDEAAEEFMSYFLPVILPALPTARDVELLSAGQAD